ncbi:MAG: helix-turn-helix domain-containing protein [Fermentimonas sp.]|jgi:IS30 family transposase
MYKQLTREQRHTIQVLLEKKVSVKEIASAINVHYSTVYRKLKRYKGKYHYHHGLAQKLYDERKRRMRSA